MTLVELKPLQDFFQTGEMLLLHSSSLVSEYFWRAFWIGTGQELVLASRPSPQHESDDDRHCRNHPKNGVEPTR